MSTHLKKTSASGVSVAEGKEKQRRDAMYRKCIYTLGEGWERAIERDLKKTNGIEKDVMKQHPYEKFETYLKMIIHVHGVTENKYSWQECCEAATLAYLYGIYRCVVQKYDYIENYIKKVMRIYIKCAIFICSYEVSKHISLEKCYQL